jgi:hypothetical protein
MDKLIPYHHSVDLFKKLLKGTLRLFDEMGHNDIDIVIHFITPIKIFLAELNSFN